MKIECHDAKFSEQLKGVVLETTAPPERQLEAVRAKLGMTAIVRLSEDKQSITVKRLLLD